MVEILNDHNELTDEQYTRLTEEVLNARDLSYSPYSKFRVGCVVVTEDDKFIIGANVENASYGAGICAERVAITKAVTSGYNKFKLIAISGDDPTEYITPCGICRQFIREFSRDIPIYMYNTNGKHIKVDLSDLLPLSFGPENLLK
ncbi:unnamed protein product [Candida verbasci]|uniref:Cytidine deaminase n=1 Tax=Candida verbasci TaxID=1227364 RepID=A0A9W4TXY6_9ASCO|nr:unnamed protein product [Candida verbasci]